MSFILIGCHHCEECCQGECHRNTTPPLFPSRLDCGACHVLNQIQEQSIALLVTSTVSDLLLVSIFQIEILLLGGSYVIRQSIFGIGAAKAYALKD